MDRAQEANTLRDLANAIDEREQIDAWMLLHDTIPITITRFVWESPPRMYDEPNRNRGAQEVHRAVIAQIEKQWRSLLIDVATAARLREEELRTLLIMPEEIRQARL